MAIRENTFLLKRSNVPGKVPLAGDIQLGEIALNTADVKLYTSGTTENDIIQIGWDRINRTGDTVTGDFMFNGDFSATTISATTYLNLPTIGGGGDYLPLSGGTVTGDTIFTSGLTATTISATTYQNLPLDVFVTGATYNFTGDTLTLNRNDGNNIQITGFTYERQSDYVYPYHYSGTAPLYTLTSTSNWIIKRVDFTTPGSPITLSAIGSWDDRYILTYS